MVDIKCDELRTARRDAAGPEHAHAARAGQSSAVLSVFAHVLIVDDDAPLRRVLTRFFRTHKLEVWEAKSVAEALPRVCAEPGVAWAERADQHFLCDHAEFDAWAKGRKEYRDQKVTKVTRAYRVFREFPALPGQLMSELKVMFTPRMFRV